MSGEQTRETMELVHRLNEEGNTAILFTEHDMSVVFGLARRITVLHQGEIIADGTPEEVRGMKGPRGSTLEKRHDPGSQRDTHLLWDESYSVWRLSCCRGR